MTKRSTFLLLLLLALPACQKHSAYDAAASEAYYAAWTKRRAGDEAGYKRALAEVARQKGTWAGERAALDLSLVDESGAAGVFVQLLRAAEKVVFAKRVPEPDPARAPDAP